MRTRPALHRISLPAVLATALLLAACGSSDSSVDSADTSTTAASTTTEAEPETPADGEPADGESIAAADLEGARACLETAGYRLEPGDEDATGLTPEMMDGLGIELLLVFDDGAGSAGTIEAYATPEQAEVAADGYRSSSFEYEVGGTDTIVAKTPGSATAITEIEACLRGEPVAAGDAGERDAASEDDVDAEASAATTTTPTTTSPTTTTTAATTTTGATTTTTDPDAGDGTASDAGADLDPARAGIVATLTDPVLEEQGVFFDRDCLETWVLEFSDADAQLLDDNGGDTEDPAVSDEALEHAESVFLCLDLERLSEEYALELGYDQACVADAFESVDLEAVVDESGASIDPIFSALAGAAFDSCE